MQVLDPHTSQTLPEVAVRRQLQVTERALLQLATSVVRGDPIKSLVELITNSDDSYRRMEAHNEASYGRIMITLDRHGNILTTLDFAQGIDVDSMDECVGTYGSDVSGFSKGYAVRGFYGRGLKEAILGLGSGKVQSIRNGFYNECHLDENGLYLRPDRRVAALSDYVSLGIPYGRNGTKVSIQITKTKKLPSVGWIGFALANHTALRDIMQSPNRRVILTDGQSSEILSYTPPRGRLVLRKEGIEIPGFGATLDLTIYKSEKALNQEGYTRDGGILIRSKNGIHDSTLFKFDYNPYATKLFGEVRCDHIEELMAHGELVIDDKRDGLDAHHPFTKMLRKVVENELQPIVELEMASEDKGSAALSEDLKRRFDITLWEINRLTNRIVKAQTIHEHRLRFGKKRTATSEESKGEGLRESVEPAQGNSSYPALFAGVRLNSSQDPRVRAYFDADTGIINIATKAPSVAMYYNGSQDNREFLTLMAELISDIVFFELATVMSGNGGSERIPEVYKSLKNKYAHLVHKSMRS
jgi:hypothetical protein